MSVFWIVALVVGGAAVLRQALGCVALVRYVRRARVASIPKGPTPPLSVLKPLYGRDPGLAENLEATLRQNYPDFEVLFLHERADDPALLAVEHARRAVGDVAVRSIPGRADDVSNPKVAVLVRGEAEARHDILVSADSDVRPDALWLRDVANGLAEADAVSFLPVVFGMRTFWSRLLALAVDTDAILNFVLWRGAAVSGSTVGVRREALQRIGGYRAVADRIADDYDLGVALKRAGGRLALARRPTRLFLPGGGFRDTARLAVRWTRTIRSVLPVAIVAGLLLAAAPLLLAAAALFTPHTGLALGMLAFLAVARLLVGVVVDLRFCRDGSLLRALPLLPLAWIAEPLVVLAGFGRTVTWRGRRYRLQGRRATLVRP